MKSLFALLALVLPLTLALPLAAAQAPVGPAAPAAPKLKAANEEIQRLMQQAAAARAQPGAPSIGGGALLVLPPYQANLEYRTVDGNAAIHEREAELFVVIEGRGVLVTGGSILTQPGSAGAAARRVIEGRLVLMSMKVPRVAGGQ